MSSRVGMVVPICNSTCVRGGSRRITVRGPTWTKMQNPIRKIARAKRAESMAQVLEHLPSKYKALSSNHPPKKKLIPH
jgi:hypothetical protein